MEIRERHACEPSSVADDTLELITGTRGIGFKLSSYDVRSEIEGLVLRDLAVLERALKRDDWSDEDGYMQIPERLT